MADKILICEVGPRDGLQNVSVTVPTTEKIGLINELSLSGLMRIEATSFASPRAIPQLADAEQVMRGITRKPGVKYIVLIPNLRGAQRALDCQPDELNVVMSASESHNQANLNMTCEDSFSVLSSVIALGRASGVPINVSLSCSFGCPFEGEVPSDTLINWVIRFSRHGIDSFTLCDTTGMAYPKQVRTLLKHFRREFPRHLFTLHFHNTRDLGIANVLAAASEGVNRFDSSLGGLGGCPYAPGASGNVCTEDIVHALELEGYETNIQLDALVRMAKALRSLVGHDIPSHLLRAGPRSRRYRMDQAKKQT